MIHCKTDSSVVVRRGGVVDFGDKGKVRVLEVGQIMGVQKEGCYHGFYMRMDEVPRMLEEDTREAIWAWSFE